MITIMDDFVMLDVFSAPDYVFEVKCEQNDLESSIGPTTKLEISGGNAILYFPHFCISPTNNPISIPHSAKTLYLDE